MHFADRVLSRADRLAHPLCLGLDPHLDRIPPLFRRGAMDPGTSETAEAVESFLGAVLDRAEDRVVAVKPQSAFFEVLGWRGIRVLEGIVRRLRRADVPVLLDAKRGDIGSTATAYAAACLGEGAPLPADAVTLNPFLGPDSLTPFVERAAATGSGLFVLVKTSNPGGAALQDHRLPDGRTVSETVASWLADLEPALRGPESGWSSVGAVVGATRAAETERLRENLPRSLFLVPGFGAQGGSAAGAVRGFVPGPSGRLRGGVVNSSRGLLFPDGSDTGDARTWEASIDRALDAAIDVLGTAVAG